MQYHSVEGFFFGSIYHWPFVKNVPISFSSLLKYDAFLEQVVTLITFVADISIEF